jgi:drug/metabolite transporter (DMT)-like permease
MLESIVALVVFASAYTLIRIGLTELPPLTLGALRFIMASSLMLPLLIIRSHGNLGKLSRSDVPILLGLSIAQVFIPNFLQNIGMEYTTASVSSVLQSTTPVFTLLLSYFLLTESIGWRQILGALVGMTGVVLLSTGGNLVSLFGSVFLGNVLQVGVAASYAVSGIVGKALLRKYPPMLVVTLSFVFGSALLTVFAVIFERNQWPSSLSSEVIIAMLLLSMLYCIGLVAWYDVLQRTGVFKLYVLLFTMPVLAVVISVLVLRENFTSMDVIFSAVTLVGVGLTQLGKRS